MVIPSQRDQPGAGTPNPDHSAVKKGSHADRIMRTSAAKRSPNTGVRSSARSFRASEGGRDDTYPGATAEGGMRPRYKYDITFPPEHLAD